MMEVKFSPPDIAEEEIQEVVSVLRSGWITTGPKTKELELCIAQYTHAKRAVCLNSATACLEFVLRLIGAGPGDEVITTAYTYSASASVIHHVGAEIVLVDTAKDSYEMDYDKVEQAITERTKAIIPVDIAGRMCDYKRVYQIVEQKRHLFHAGANPVQSAIGRVIVIADAAHALGASREGTVCGQAADFTCFSFHAVKNMTTAEGGAVVWKDIDGIDNGQIYKKFQLLSLHGQDKDALAKTKLGDWEYDIVELSYKCNMTDIMAGIGMAQLRRYPQMLEKRGRIIERYNEAFEKLPLEILRHDTDEQHSSRHLYMVRLPGRNSRERNGLIESMAREGIATNVHYKPLPLFTAYKKLGFKIEDYKNAFARYENEITLPLYTTLTDDQVEYITEKFCYLIGKLGM